MLILAQTFQTLCKTELLETQTKQEEPELPPEIIGDRQKISMIAAKIVKPYQSLPSYQ